MLFLVLLLLLLLCLLLTIEEELWISIDGFLEHVAEVDLVRRQELLWLWSSLHIQPVFLTLLRLGQLMVAFRARYPIYLLGSRVAVVDASLPRQLLLAVAVRNEFL